jgi:transcriptional regulator with XRE-family HTH domain
MRTELGITITTVAGELGQWVSIISRLERGHIRNDDLAATYRQWLTEQVADSLSPSQKDQSHVPPALIPQGHTSMVPFP